MSASGGDGGRGGSFASIVETHTGLKALLHQIETCQDAGVCAALLGTLAGQLSHHFAEEEGEGGFFDRILDETPRFQRRVEALRAEHREIGGLVGMLIGRAVSGVGRNSVLAEAASLAARLRRHEAEESDLMMECCLVDVGAGD